MQGVWSPEERDKTIAFREIRALRLVLERIPLVNGGSRRTEKKAAGEEGRGGQRRRMRCWTGISEWFTLSDPW